jgi:hypothetical protein
LSHWRGHPFDALRSAPPPGKRTRRWPSEVKLPDDPASAGRLEKLAETLAATRTNPGPHRRRTGASQGTRRSHGPETQAHASSTKGGACPPRSGRALGRHCPHLRGLPFNDLKAAVITKGRSRAVSPTGRSGPFRFKSQRNGFLGALLRGWTS